MGASSKEEYLFMNPSLQEADLNKDLGVLPCYNYTHMNSWKEDGKCSGQTSAKQTSLIALNSYII